MNTNGQSKVGLLPIVLSLLWIASLPLCLLFGNRLLSSVPVLKADRLAYAIAVVPFVIMAVRQRRWLQRPGSVEIAMAIYFVLIVLSWASTWSSKDLVSFKQDADFLLACFVMPFTAFVIARNSQWDQKRITACVWVLVGIVGTYLMVFGAVQYLYDWSFLVPEALKTIHPDRAKGPFDNAVPYGVVLSMLCVLMLFLWNESHGRWARAGLLIIALGIVQGIVASKTRAAWLALPIGLCLPALRYARVRWLAALLIVDLVAQVVLAPAVGLDFWGIRKRLVQPEPVYDRVAVTATASNMIQHRPWFGFGFGLSTFDADKARYYSSWGGISTRWAVYPNNPHNDVLNVVVMMGVFGLIAYLALLWTIGRLLWRRAARAEDGNGFARALATFVLAMFLVLLIAGQFHSTMNMSFAQVLLFFLAGIVAHQSLLAGAAAAPATAASASATARGTRSA